MTPTPQPALARLRKRLSPRGAGASRAKSAPAHNASRSLDDASARLERLSRGVLISTVVAVASLGFGIASSAAAQAQVETVTGDMHPVVIASKAIAAGTTITADQVSLVEVPATYLVDGALADAGALIGKTVCVSVPANTQMSGSLIADLGNTSSASAKIPAGQRAVTVNVTASTGLSSLLRCGDRVEVYASTQSSSLYRIAESVTVLALDGALSGPSAGTSYSTVTLQVTDAEAEAILAAEQGGTISLALIPMAESR